jgi:hypothetical protein
LDDVFQLGDQRDDRTHVRYQSSEASDQDTALSARS